MISLEEAIHRAIRCATPLKHVEEVSIFESSGRILADDVIARSPLPRFDQSAMDGFAVNAQAGLSTGDRLPIQGTVEAGSSSVELISGHAIKIFTGAPMPTCADAVIMQEHVTISGEQITLQNLVRPGENMRKKGEDITPGNQILRRGRRVDARTIAVLASQGIDKVTVRQRPAVAILSTGNELRSAGSQLDSSAIYDTNGPMLGELAARAGCSVIARAIIPDNETSLLASISYHLKFCDLIVTSGGASVGNRDVLAQIAQSLNFEKLSIAMKPGKPALVGKIGRTAILGLPGNPLSALISWMLLAEPMIKSMTWQDTRTAPVYPLPSLTAYARKPGRTEFVPARLVHMNGIQNIELLAGGSAALTPLLSADGIAEIHSSSSLVAPGSLLRFYPFHALFQV